MTDAEREVLDAALNWYRWHGYIPNLAAEYYEVPLIKSIQSLLNSHNTEYLFDQTRRFYPHNKETPK